MFKKNKYILILSGIFILGTLLRFYRFYPNLILNGEMGTDYMNIWNIIHGERTFLIGPRTSHEWFFISPIAYWIYTAILLIWNYNPVAINVFWGVIGAAAILICYYTIKKIFDKNIALIASFLIAVSPAWIMQARDSRYNLAVSILFFPYLLFLFNSIKDKGRSLFKLGLIMGLMMSFFPSPLLLIPAAVISFIFFKVKPKLKYILYSFLGFLIPNVTFLIYEFFNKFSVTVQLLSWIPYRLLGFFGIYRKNTVNREVFIQNIKSIYRFFADVFLGYENFWALIIFIITITASIYLVKKFYRNKKTHMGFFLLIINLIVCYLGLFIHGNPPSHYYYVIFPVPVILTAYILSKLIKNRVMLAVSVILLGLTGILGLMKLNWFYPNYMQTDNEINIVPYAMQLEITDAILKNASDASFNLKRIGLNDKFENDFANNYIYLLTVKGAKIDTNSDLLYTIIEGRKYTQKIQGKMIYSKNGVTVYETKI